jgi:hypothetical protein
MARSITERFGILESVGDLTRSLETISRRVARTMDRAIRRLEGTPVRTPAARRLDQESPAVQTPATALTAVQETVLQAQAVALEGIAATAGASSPATAGQTVKALADEALLLTETVTALAAETMDAPKPRGRREPVSAATLPGRVISFKEAAEALTTRAGSRRRA